MTARAYGKMTCKDCGTEVVGLIRAPVCPKCCGEMRDEGPLRLADDGVQGNPTSPT